MKTVMKKKNNEQKNNERREENLSTFLQEYAIQVSLGYVNQQQRIQRFTGYLFILYYYETKSFVHKS